MSGTVHYEVIGSLRTRTLRVLWALEELGVAYRWTDAAPRSEAVLALNASGKVPLLRVGDTVLRDSVAIVQYLADAHGALTHPAGSLARAEQDSFTQFACEELDGPLWLASRHRFVLPKDMRIPAVIDVARQEFARALDTLEARLGDREFVAGDVLTVPDIVLGHCAGWAVAARFELPGGRSGAYFDRLRSRPAYLRAMRAGWGKRAVMPPS